MSSIYTVDLVARLAQMNSFQTWQGSQEPTIVVFRNCDGSGGYVPQSGLGLQDIICLVDDMCMPLHGRSWTSDKYQRRQIETNGREGANRILSSYVKNAWQHGTHFGFPAAVQEVTPFPILRSVDMIYGNDDDYTQYAVVADNFHGWADESAGCVTLRGLMQPQLGGPTDQWKVAHDWLYGKHANQRNFSLMIFERQDLEVPQVALRFGSSGPSVIELQQKLQKLGLYRGSIDGIFGYGCLWAVRQLSKKLNMPGHRQDGVADRVILDWLARL